MYYTKSLPPNKSEKEYSTSRLKCYIITFYGAEERNDFNNIPWIHCLNATPSLATDLVVLFYLFPVVSLVF